MKIGILEAGNVGVNLARLLAEAGHDVGDLCGEEFHHHAALAALATLRGTPPSGKGRP